MTNVVPSPRELETLYANGFINCCFYNRSFCTPFKTTGVWTGIYVASGRLDKSLLACNTYWL